jgi:hypothetical protein
VKSRSIRMVCGICPPTARKSVSPVYFEMPLPLQFSFQCRYSIQ